jgi:hypothetical protein
MNPRLEPSHLLHAARTEVKNTSIDGVVRGVLVFGLKGH